MKREYLAIAVVSLLVLAPNTFAQSQDDSDSAQTFPTSFDSSLMQNPFDGMVNKLKEQEILNRPLPTFNMNPSSFHFNSSNVFHYSLIQPQQAPAPADDADADPAAVAEQSQAPQAPAALPVAAIAKPAALAAAAQAVQGSVDVAAGLGENAPHVVAVPVFSYPAFKAVNIDPPFMSPSLASAPADPLASGSGPSQQPVAQPQAAPVQQAVAQPQQELAPQAAPVDQQITADPQQAANQAVDAVASLNNLHQDVDGSVACTDDSSMKDAYHRYDEKGSEKLRKKGDAREEKMDAAFQDVLNRSIKDASDVAKMKWYKKAENKDYELPAKQAMKASCILVIPGEKSVAFGSLGFTYGAGAYKCKDASSASGWGPTHFVQSEGISKGFQIGAKDTDRVLFFDGPDAIKQLSGSTLNVCAGAAVAAGPWGRDGQVCTDASLKPIISYSKTEGLFAGISLQGVRIHEDKNMEALENNQFLSQQKRHWYTLGFRAGHRNICSSPMASDQLAGNPDQDTAGSAASTTQASQAGKM